MYFLRSFGCKWLKKHLKLVQEGKKGSACVMARVRRARKGGSGCRDLNTIRTISSPLCFSLHTGSMLSGKLLHKAGITVPAAPSSFSQAGKQECPWIYTSSSLAGFLVGEKKRISFALQKMFIPSSKDRTHSFIQCQEFTSCYNLNNFILEVRIEVAWCALTLSELLDASSCAILL